MREESDIIVNLRFRFYVACLPQLEIGQFTLFPEIRVNLYIVIKERPITKKNSYKQINDLRYIEIRKTGCAIGAMCGIGFW